MATSQTGRNEGEAFVQARPETPLAMPLTELQGFYRILRLSATGSVSSEDYYFGPSSADQRTAPSERNDGAPIDDLTSDEWELAKAAAMIAVAARLDKPDDFLSYVRASISNI